VYRRAAPSGAIRAQQDCAPTRHPIRVDPRHPRKVVSVSSVTSCKNPSATISEIRGKIRGQIAPFFRRLNLFADEPAAFGVDKAWASLFADFPATPGSGVQRAVQPLNPPNFRNHKPSEKEK